MYSMPVSINPHSFLEENGKENGPESPIEYWDEPPEYDQSDSDAEYRMVKLCEREDSFVSETSSESEVGDGKDQNRPPSPMKYWDDSGRGLQPKSTKQHPMPKTQSLTENFPPVRAALSKFYKSLS
ncbi:hypothetical protein TNIN_250671 [Trichonephila inaurata madagascariensis]|uniref:Uncharacterized protein n=1 Tax=Trichonephila inaurata madagascariensis TaxID=2747483 RepID=A0A8X6YUA2_9ARAC|nr:hypothetical protein TNIN_250671 [Trichonephila inaurata madagascariensis]